MLFFVENFLNAARECRLPTLACALFLPGASLLVDQQDCALPVLYAYTVLGMLSCGY
jgi:hypothetical protein